MRIIANCSGLFVIVGLLILIHTSIINTNLRDSEVNSGLSSATDYAIDVMRDYLADLEFESSDKEATVNEIIKIFCTSVEQVIGSDGKVNVYVVDADSSTGSFSFIVEEEYEYAFHRRPGIARCERSIKFSL